MSYKIIEMQLDRYSELIDFWKSCEGIYLSDDDEYDNLEIYLKRNRKSNFIVVYENEIIGTIKSSHDGRRGYIHHLAVKKEFRKQGIARELVNKCIEIIRAGGVHKYRIFVLDSNEGALKFWKQLGFKEQIYNYRTFQMNTVIPKTDGEL